MHPHGCALNVNPLIGIEKGERKMEMNDNYIAGFFDGEGSVMLTVQTDRRKKYLIYVRPRIVITQKTREVLEGIQKHVECGRIESRKSRNPSNQTEFLGGYNLVFEAIKDCMSFSRRINGKCFIKQPQLDLLTEFFKVRSRLPRGDMGYRKKDILVLLDYVKQMRKINKERQTYRDIEKIRKDISNFDEGKHIEKIKNSRIIRGKLRMEGNKLNLKNIPEEKLRDLYLNQKLSCVSIAKIFNVCQHTIVRRLKRYNIPARKPPEDLLVWKESNQGDIKYE